MIADGTISGGMIPKVQACIEAVSSGAHSAHMLDGRIPHVLLLELFTDAGIGTMVTASAAAIEDEVTASAAAIEDEVTASAAAIEDEVTA
jgi:hypothetical protein